jgi:hypothetical protein
VIREIMSVVAPTPLCLALQRLIAFVAGWSEDSGFSHAPELGEVVAALMPFVREEERALFFARFGDAAETFDALANGLFQVPGAAFRELCRIETSIAKRGNPPVCRVRPFLRLSRHASTRDGKS